MPEDERHHTDIRDAGFLWQSANMTGRDQSCLSAERQLIDATDTVSTVALGTLSSSIFYLGFIESALVILFFNLLCTLPVALFSTWGAATGLRQMVLGRYSFGTIGIYFPGERRVLPACFP